MPNLTPAPPIIHQLLTDTGVIAAGHLLFSYSAGTSTKQATYTDVGGLVAHANPILLDAAGRVPSGLFLLPASYKFVLAPPGDTDPPTASIWSRDNIGATPGTNVDNDVNITAGEALATPEVIYLSDGSGGLTAGRWYKADADNVYSSLLPVVGFAVADAASGASGTARLSGRLTGFLGLTAGADYYISTTAGAITTSATGNARYLGRADSVSSLIVTPNPGSVTDVGLCEGRLTLTTGVPVTTADVTAATTIFWAPYTGTRVALVSGASWKVMTFPQLSIAVPATTATGYDVFAYDNAGVVALEVLAWTNLTTRATALTTLDGVLVKTGATTRRYLGSFRTTAVSGQTEDSLTKRFLYNYYHRVERPLRRVEATATWAYDGVFRQANNAAANQVEIFNGVAEGAITLHVTATFKQATAASAVAIVIGEDSVTAASTSSTGSTAVPEVNTSGALAATLIKVPAVGYHYYAWLEASSAATTTWYGTVSNPTLSNGLVGMVIQ